MADVTIKYKDSVIAEMDSNGVTTANTSGCYCEGNIVVEYTPNVRTYEITLTKKSGWTTLTTLDADVLAHMNDADLTVTLEKLGAYEYVYYAVPYMIAKNAQLCISAGYPMYGIAVRVSGENGANAPFCYYKPNDSTTDVSLGKPRFRLNGNNYLAMPADGFFAAGTYRLTFNW
jgi:hypothetical protein